MATRFEPDRQDPFIGLALREGAGAGSLYGVKRYRATRTASRGRIGRAQRRAPLVASFGRALQGNGGLMNGTGGSEAIVWTKLRQA